MALPGAPPLHNLARAGAVAGGAARAGRTPAVDRLVRVGFVARAIVYGLIGGLSGALALGIHGGTTTDQQGALALMASTPVGWVALLVLSAALLAYGIWKLVQAAAGRGPEGGGGSAVFDRLANAAGGLTYVVFFAIAVGALAGDHSGGASSSRRAAAGVLSWPAGPLLVGIGGAVLVAVSLYQIAEAVTAGFLKDIKTGEMSPRMRFALVWLGRVGLASRALVFGLVGYFLIRAAVMYDPGNATGLDGALRAVAEQSYGHWLLGAVAGGLLVFSAFSLLEGRYRRL